MPSPPPTSPSTGAIRNAGLQACKAAIHLMSKSTLRILAALLSAAIVAVLFAGLDSLPRDLRNQIAAERTAFAAAQKQLDSAKVELDRDRSQEAALFAALPSARGYSDRISRGQSMLVT